ncbi:MAG TPA: helix-turn-helix domain-containing protein [Acidobacteriota bacterium]|nr:helix-turn-helix domain-containing protein [Acidobacteriota bacterium]
MSITDTVSRILEVSREQFFAHGFASVTMDDIARELGMSKRTLYHHFSSKEELLLKAVEQKLYQVGSGLDEIIGRQDLSFIEKMPAVLEFLSLNLPRPSKAFVRDVNRFVPHIWTTVDSRRVEIIRRCFSRLLSEGIQEGSVRNDVQPELLIMVLLTLVQHLVTPETLSRLPVTLNQLFEQVIDLFFRGVLSEEGRQNLKISNGRLL